MVEAVRFELTDPFESLVFKTRAIDHSTTLPIIYGANLKLAWGDVRESNS